MPYLWALFQRAQTLHQPIIRPTFYDFPDDAACFADCDDFMRGDALLAAPVVQAGATTRDVCLPAGPAAWLDFHTGALYDAGCVHTVDAPLYSCRCSRAQVRQFRWHAARPAGTDTTIRSANCCGSMRRPRTPRHNLNARHLRA